MTTHEEHEAFHDELLTVLGDAMPYLAAAHAMANADDDELDAKLEAFRQAVLDYRSRPESERDAEVARAIGQALLGRELPADESQAKGGD